MKKLLSLLLLAASSFTIVGDNDEFGTNDVAIVIIYSADDRWALRRYQARQEHDEGIAHLNFTNYVVWSIGQQRTNTTVNEMKMLGLEGLALFGKSPVSVQGQVMTVIGLTNLPPSFIATTNAP